MEAAGIEPASNIVSTKASTGVVCFLIHHGSKTNKNSHDRPFLSFRLNRVKGQPHQAYPTS